MTEMVDRDRGPYINRQSPIDLPLISDLSILILSILIETDLWSRPPKSDVLDLNNPSNHHDKVTRGVPSGLKISKK